MSFENTRNHNENIESRPAGQKAAFAISLLGGLFAAYKARAENQTLAESAGRALEAAGQYHRAYRKIDPDGTISGNVEDFILRGIDRIRNVGNTDSGADSNKRKKDPVEDPSRGTAFWDSSDADTD